MATAYTDIKHVSSLASGGGDGSVGNPWTLAEGLAKINTRRLIKVWNDGTYNISSGITTAVDTTAPSATTGYCVVAAVDSTTKNPITDIANSVVVDGTGMGSGNMITIGGDYHAVWHGMKLQNGPGVGWYGPTRNFIGFAACAAVGMGSHGYHLDAGTVLAGCESSGNTGQGANLFNQGAVYRSRFFGNTGHGLVMAAYGHIVGNLIRDNDNGLVLNDVGNTVWSNTIDANADGIYTNAAQFSYNWNMITNNTNGLNLDTSAEVAFLIENNYYGNTANKTGAGRWGVEIGDTYLDPQYVDIANNDPAIGNSNLMRAFADNGIDANIGCWQG